MISKRSLVSIVVGIGILWCAGAQAAISLRAGVASPLGETRDLSKTGWSAQVMADVRALPLSSLAIVVQFSAAGYGQKQYDFVSGTATRSQKSQLTFTGGGIGVRLMPPAPLIKPFAEIVGRVSSIQQDFRDNEDKASVESKTVLGYEINGGLRFGVSPGFDLEVGGGYTGFAKTKLKHKDTTVEIAPHGWQAFVGVAMTLGL
jgi:hypothetical protein